jgi:hypothetical protein
MRVSEVGERKNSTQIKQSSYEEIPLHSPLAPNPFSAYNVRANSMRSKHSI